MKHFHFIGIGGTGLSAIARVLLERGAQVSGSDLVLSPNAQELAAMGVKVTIGHAQENIAGADIVIRSSAIPPENIEIVTAIAKGIPVMKRSQFLGELTYGKKVIAVAGTHGKTTTSAMITWALTRLGQDPSYIVGSEVKNLKSNAHNGNGEYFVIEADEYDGMFLGLTPYLLIITNIEHDHPDYYPTPESYYAAFSQLCDLITREGRLIANSDNINTHHLAEAVRMRTPIHFYGESVDAEYRIMQIRNEEGCGVSFDMKFENSDGDGFILPNITLQVPGKHNAQNAGAVIACAHQLGLSVSDAALALEEFAGTGRRFDIRGENQGVLVIDDYAHHPTEIRATLAAARCKYSHRSIWVVWQPHTYSRTQQLFDEFSQSFTDCDHVIVTEVYASREKPRDFSAREVVLSMRHPDAHFIAGLRECADFLLQNIHPGDVVIVLSAGDANQISTWILNEFKPVVKHA